MRIACGVGCSLMRHLAAKLTAHRGKACAWAVPSSLEDRLAGIDAVDDTETFTELGLILPLLRFMQRTHLTGGLIMPLVKGCF